MTFGIYRKPTHTEYLGRAFEDKSNDYNPKLHQPAVFNSLENRLLNTALEQTEYTKEYKHIQKQQK